jgi:putative FmdB family regulatory protein
MTLPLYAYRCTQCGHRFEKIQNFSAEPEKECPKCQGVLERPLTAPRLNFKGAGWYVNDYAGKSSASELGSESKPAGGSTEAKAPSSSESTSAAPAASAAPASAPPPSSASSTSGSST